MIKERVIDNRQYDCFGDNLKVHSTFLKKRSAKNQRKANTKKASH